MYEFLKILLPAAEEIFNIRNITMQENDPYFGNRIKIEGADGENNRFELILTSDGHKTSSGGAENEHP